ncbi:hypothetical protein PM082_014983 [Marasmius tenuissimus]|nr:hypothetical protein PM082_014983 [Marasmius tenuissimus]
MKTASYYPGLNLEYDQMNAKHWSKNKNNNQFYPHSDLPISQQFDYPFGSYSAYPPPNGYFIEESNATWGAQSSSNLLATGEQFIPGVVAQTHLNELPHVPSYLAASVYEPGFAPTYSSQGDTYLSPPCHVSFDTPTTSRSTTPFSLPPSPSNYPSELSEREHNERPFVGSRARTQLAVARRKTEPKFFCEVPGCPSRGFTKKHNLEYHQRSHLNIRPFKCVSCLRAFHARSDLTRHNRRMKGGCGPSSSLLPACEISNAERRC